MTMQLSYSSAFPSSLVSALNMQQSVSTVQPLNGEGALAYARWSKSILAHLRQRYRAGHTSAARMEVILADICSHLSGVSSSGISERGV
jgi:hypothetical protein